MYITKISIKVLYFIINNRKQDLCLKIIYNYLILAD